MKATVDLPPGVTVETVQKFIGREATRRVKSKAIRNATRLLKSMHPEDYQDLLQQELGRKAE